MLMLPSALLLTISSASPLPAATVPIAPGPVASDTQTQVLMPFSAPYVYLAAPADAALQPGEPDASVPASPPPINPATPAPAPPAEPPHEGDIVITGRAEAAGDPLQAVNAQSFAVTQKVDDAVIGPAARTYKETVPRVVRKGIHNFLYNLREPIVALNFMLQLKPGKAVETVGRFAINSTVGAAGLIDMAKRKPFRLPRRSNGFANTLGYYGVKNGPFLFLPVIGPTTVRDLLGGAIDRLVLPVGVGRPFDSLTYSVPAGVLGALDHRSSFDKTLKDLHDNSPDPYAATRAFYLSRRQAEIDQLHGRGTADPAGMTGPPTSVRPFVPSDLEPPSPPETPAPRP